MGKMKKKRRLEEVYNATLEIKQAEITPVLSGNYPMQGPVPVEMDNAIKMASFQVNKGVGSSGRSQKSEARVGSGTCNMCSTPCSSCFHNNQAIIRSKSGEFSGETYRDNVYNFSKLAPTLKSRKCETGQHSASEASIVITMNSSPDSFSENAESKATLQNVELSSKLSSGVPTTENQDKFELHKLESDSLENNLKDFRDFEGHDENISCISGADGVTTVSSADSRTVETKSLPTSAASTNSLVPKDNVKVVSSEAAQCLQNLDVEGSKFFTKSKCDDIATREVCPPVCFPDHLHDSRLLENTLLEDTDDAAGSVSVQSIYPNTLKGKSGELYFRSQLGGETPDCPREYLNPFVTNKMISNTLCGKESTYCISGDTRDMKLGVVGVNPKPEMEKCVKLEAKDDAIIAGLATEALISLQHILEVEKVGELLGLPVAKETSIQSRPTEALNFTEQNHVNNESDILEHDQVCDTCGDIGREYLLVVCCRCSDGAEHTYCMPKMLDKIPEGGWMCQECKMEERKSQDNDNCDEVGGVAHQFSVHVNAKISHPCDKSGGKDTYSETNKINKDSSCVKLPCKRNEDNVKGSSEAKEQALEPTVTSPKNSLDRVGLHLHSSSFKNSDRGGSKLARKLHSVGYLLADTKGTEAPTLGTRLPKPRGSLSKSNSFSAAHTKPKSKLVDEVFRKQKSMQNPALPHGKEGSSRVMGKSASSKSLDSDRLRFDESKAKMLPLKFSHSRDLAGFKHAKEQNFAKRKSSFEFEHSVASSPMASSTIFPRRVDQPPVSGSELVCITNKCEPNTVLTDGKLEPPMPVNNAIWAMEEPVLNGDLKKHLPCFSSTIGNYAEQKPVHARMKDAETKSDSCRKRGDAKLLASDVLTARNSKEVKGKCNKPKAETEAAQSKKTGSYRNDKVLGVSTLNSKCEVSSYNELSSSSNARRLVADDKVLKEGQDLNTNSTKQPTSTSAEAVNFRIVDSLPNLPIDRIPNLMDFPNQAFKETSSHLTNSALPEYEYIWQGCFEVHKSGKLPDICDGFQAHLSTCASPRVIETMNIFPHKVLLNEVPRLSTWPIQFVETGVREAHIGLYFFAQDYESYVKCYKNMVDRMMKDDLALKGNIDGAEILIFPSNQLPEKSQCWNMMFFLWGVFKEKRFACQQQGNGSWMKVSSPHDIPKAIMSSPESILSLVPIDKEELVSHMEVVSDALADLPHLLTAGTSCETDSLPAFQKVTCSNLTVEQPEHILECNSLSSIPKCLSQSLPEVRSTPGSKTVGIAGSLFPLDPFAVKNVHVGGTSILSNGEGLHQERVPNLELALGTEVISTKKRTRDHALVRESTETEEDIPAALSLSLSFPFTDEDHCTTSFVNGTAPICRGTC